MPLSKIQGIDGQVTPNLGRRNLLYNGAMQIDQRGSRTTSHGANTYFVDRFNVYIQAGAVATVSQSTDVPTGQGYTTSAKIDVTTADTSIGATDLNLLRQPLEGKDVQHLYYGTSSAKQLTLSFWVKSPKTGTHICELYNAASAGARQVSKSYTISSANTWEHKTLTFDGDTVRNFDNGSFAEMYVQWVLTAGSNYTSGTLNTSWANVTEANRYVGQVNIFDNTNNNFYLTGAQLEVGDTATEFEHLSFGEELALCKRYYEHSYPYGTAAGTANGGIGAYHIHAGASRGTNYAFVTQRYTVEKRAAGTVTVFSYGGQSGQMSNGDSGANIGAVGVIQNGATSFLPRNTSGSTLSDQALIYHYRCDAEL